MLFVPWEPVLRKNDNRVYVITTTAHHTYGDPVRGVVHFENARQVFLESLELKFGGECGTNIRYPVKQQVWTRFGPAEQVYYRKAKQVKTLFLDSRTVTEGTTLEPGHHEWPFEFHFPEREEIELAPNAEPFTVVDYFWVRYEISANANFIDSNHTKGSLKASRYPTFLDSRRDAISGPSIASELAISRRPSVAERLPNSIRRTSTAVETFRLVLNTPALIVTNESLPVTLTVMDTSLDNAATESSPSDPSKLWRLTKFKLFVKYRIRLTAERHTVTVDLGKSEIVEICSFAAKKGTDAPEFYSNEDLDVGQRLNLKTPKAIRPTFNNELIHFDHVFKVSIELEHEGREFNAKFTDIAVEIQPEYIQESLPAFHEALGEPPPPFSTVMATSPVETSTTTPPATTPATTAATIATTTTSATLPAATALAVAPPSPPPSDRVTPPPYARDDASDIEDVVLDPMRRGSWSPL